jgi:site-specific recombinase XerD
MFTAKCHLFFSGICHSTGHAPSVLFEMLLHEEELRDGDAVGIFQAFPEGRTLAAVRSLFRFAERVGYCRNVASGVDLPHNDQHLAERIVPEAAIQQMVELEPEPRNRALLALLYTTGLRVSEACGLCWADLKERDGSAQITVVGKGRRTRSVFAPAAIWVQLFGVREGADPHAPVFRSRSGKPLERSRVLRIVRDAAARAGVPEGVTTHWLRHAHASHALDRGAPIHLVQATLGHASIATTSRYLHARPGDSSARFIASF